MSAAETQQARTLAYLRQRYGGMGLPVRPMPDERSLLVSLPMGPAPFESPAGPQTIERVVFATIDAGRIKCLRPAALFGLPILDVRDATDARGIEAVIRRAWRERIDQLRDSPGRAAKSASCASTAGSNPEPNSRATSPPTSTACAGPPGSARPATGPAAFGKEGSPRARAGAKGARLGCGRCPPTATVRAFCSSGRSCSRTLTCGQPWDGRGSASRRPAARPRPSCVSPGRRRTWSSPSRPWAEATASPSSCSTRRDTKRGAKRPAPSAPPATSSGRETRTASSPAWASSSRRRGGAASHVMRGASMRTSSA